MKVAKILQKAYNK